MQTDRALSTVDGCVFLVGCSPQKHVFRRQTLAFNALPVLFRELQHKLTVVNSSDLCQPSLLTWKA